MPSSKIYFYRPFQGGSSFVDHSCYLYLVFAMLSCLFIAALWSTAGKGVTFWLSFVIFNCAFVTFPCGILGQVWYLILSIPDPCHISNLPFASATSPYQSGINRWWTSQISILTFGPRREKTCLQGFRQSVIQTNLLSYRD